MAGKRAFADLERSLGYHFRRPDLLAEALTHRSYANEQGEEAKCADNEKLEFLGDAVLDVVVSHLLMDRFPELDEGALSVRRAQVVSETGLSEVARAVDLGRWLYLGRGEERTGGRDKASLLADALEAVVAAVYLDGGFGAAWDLVVRLFGPRLEPGQEKWDHKTRLQELAQGRMRATPIYEVVAESGPDHAKEFHVRVLIEGREYGRAQGRSKKEAEQGAARDAIVLLTRVLAGTP